LVYRGRNPSFKMLSPNLMLKKNGMLGKNYKEEIR
jgi:hypothetical protein